MSSDGWRERLAEEIERQGLSMKAVSQKARLGETYVRDALARGRGKEENLRKIAAALDISYEWLLHGIGDRHARRLGQGETSWFIPILGEVAAGLWLDRKHFDTPLEKRPASPFPPDPRYPIEAQFDLVVRGESLNRFARDGDLLRCVSCDKAGIEPNDGDLVIVERTRHGSDVETTAKRLFRRSGLAELRPESDDPRWQEAIKLDRQTVGEGAVTVTAIVLYAYKAARQR
jgi:lambda repressor-like predicted transcriptional regulator